LLKFNPVTNIPAMKVRLLVDFEAFWTSLARDIRAADKNVFVETFSFEGDRAGRLLADVMIESSARDKRILADSFSTLVLSDKCLYVPGNWFDKQLALELKATTDLHASLRAKGVTIKHGNPFGLSPRRWLTRNHKKLIIIDDRVAYIGGINFSEHNASWHDMMLRIEDADVARFFRNDFLGCWNGKSLASSRQFAGAEMHTLDGRSNRAVFRKVLDLVAAAQSSIFIASPYISFPFYDHLRDASRRNVAVTILTPQTNNWRYFTDYAKWESARCGITLRLYTKGMSHLKAMLVDDQFLVVGSSNFDFLSYRVYEEIVAIITDSDVIANFREQVMIEDLRHSERVEEQVEARRSGWAGLRLKLFNKGLTLLLE
jgi:cardiolipin synthase